MPTPDVSPADLSAAIALWRRYAPPAYRSIISGGKIFAWDAERAQYKNMQTGRYVDMQYIRRMAIDPFLRNVKNAIRTLTETYQRGEITLDEWLAEMERYVGTSQLAAALVAGGGADAKIDYALLAAEVASAYLLLQKFYADIRTGKQKTNGRLTARALLYGALARSVYEDVTRQNAIGIGKRFERRVLAAGADHCETHGSQKGCVELAQLGWQAIGTLPKLYDTPCQTNCLCRFEFR